VYLPCFKRNVEDIFLSKKILRTLRIDSDLRQEQGRHAHLKHYTENKPRMLRVFESIHRTSPRKSFNKQSFFNRGTIFISEGNTTVLPIILYIYCIFHIIKINHVLYFRLGLNLIHHELSSINR